MDKLLVLEPFVLKESGRIVGEYGAREINRQIRERDLAISREKQKEAERIVEEEKGKRPKWKFGANEKKIRWLINNFVVRAEHRSKMISEDESISWLVLYKQNGESIIVESDDGIFGDLEVSMYNGVIVLNHWKEREYQKMVNEIDVFDEKNSRDLLEYNRLRRKFEGMEN